MPARLKDILQFRELLYFLVWGELKVRYKQTVLGVAWAVIPPLAIMVVFTIFFGLVIRVPTGEVPYPIFVYSGTVVWTYFAYALDQSSNSLVRYEGLITKVYFPKVARSVSPRNSRLDGLLYRLRSAGRTGGILWFCAYRSRLDAASVCAADRDDRPGGFALAIGVERTV